MESSKEEVCAPHWIISYVRMLHARCVAFRLDAKRTFFGFVCGCMYVYVGARVFEEDEQRSMRNTSYRCAEFYVRWGL